MERDSVVVVSSGSDQDDDEQISYKRKVNDINIKSICEKFKNFIFSQSDEGTYLHQKLSDFSKELIQTCNNKMYPISKKTFLWTNLLQWLMAIKIGNFDDKSIFYDENLYLVLVDIIGEYINFQSENREISSLTNDTEKIANNILLALYTTFGDKMNFILMTLLKLKIRTEKNDILYLIHKKILSDKRIYLEHELGPYVLVILCYRQWKKLARNSEDNEEIDQVADTILTKNVPSITEYNQNFALVTEAISHAAQKLNSGTSILLRKDLFDLDEAKSKYFEQYKHYISTCNTTRLKTFTSKSENSQQLRHKNIFQLSSTGKIVNRNFIENNNSRFKSKNVQFQQPLKNCDNHSHVKNISANLKNFSQFHLVVSSNPVLKSKPKNCDRLKDIIMIDSSDESTENEEETIYIDSSSDDEVLIVEETSQKSVNNLTNSLPVIKSNEKCSNSPNKLISSCIKGETYSNTFSNQNIFNFEPLLQVPSISSSNFELDKQRNKKTNENTIYKRESLIQNDLLNTQNRYQQHTQNIISEKIINKNLILSLPEEKLNISNQNLHSSQSLTPSNITNSLISLDPKNSMSQKETNRTDDVMGVTKKSCEVTSSEFPTTVQENTISAKETEKNLDKYIPNNGTINLTSQPKNIITMNLNNLKPSSPQNHIKHNVIELFSNSKTLPAVNDSALNELKNSTQKIQMLQNKKMFINGKIVQSEPKCFNSQIKSTAQNSIETNEKNNLFTPCKINNKKMRSKYVTIRSTAIKSQHGNIKSKTLTIKRTLPKDFKDYPIKSEKVFRMELNKNVYNSKPISLSKEIQTYKRKSPNVSVDLEDDCIAIKTDIGKNEISKNLSSSKSTETDNNGRVIFQTSMTSNLLKCFRKSNGIKRLDESFSEVEDFKSNKLLNFKRNFPSNIDTNTEKFCNEAKQNFNKDTENDLRKSAKKKIKSYMSNNVCKLNRISIRKNKILNNRSLYYVNLNNNNNFNSIIKHKHFENNNIKYKKPKNLSICKAKIKRKNNNAVGMIYKSLVNKVNQNYKMKSTLKKMDKVEDIRKNLNNTNQKLVSFAANKSLKFNSSFLKALGVAALNNGGLIQIKICNPSYNDNLQYSKNKQTVVPIYSNERKDFLRNYINSKWTIEDISELNLIQFRFLNFEITMPSEIKLQFLNFVKNFQISINENLNSKNYLQQHNTKYIASSSNMVMSDLSIKYLNRSYLIPKIACRKINSKLFRFPKVSPYHIKNLTKCNSNTFKYNNYSLLRNLSGTKSALQFYLGNHSTTEYLSLPDRVKKFNINEIINNINRTKCKHDKEIFVVQNKKSEILLSKNGTIVKQTMSFRDKLKCFNDVNNLNFNYSNIYKNLPNLTLNEHNGNVNKQKNEITNDHREGKTIIEQKNEFQNCKSGSILKQNNSINTFNKNVHICNSDSQMYFPNNKVTHTSKKEDSVKMQNEKCPRVISNKISVQKEINSKCLENLQECVTTSEASILSINNKKNSISKFNCTDKTNNKILEICPKYIPNEVSQKEQNLQGKNLYPKGQQEQNGNLDIILPNKFENVNKPNDLDNVFNKTPFKLRFKRSLSYQGNNKLCDDIPPQLQSLKSCKISKIEKDLAFNELCSHNHIQLCSPTISFSDKSNYKNTEKDGHNKKKLMNYFGLHLKESDLKDLATNKLKVSKKQEHKLSNEKLNSITTIVDKNADKGLNCLKDIKKSQSAETDFINLNTLAATAEKQSLILDEVKPINLILYDDEKERTKSKINIESVPQILSKNNVKIKEIKNSDKAISKSRKRIQHLELDNSITNHLTTYDIDNSFNIINQSQDLFSDLNILHPPRTNKHIKRADISKENKKKRASNKEVTQKETDILENIYTKTSGKEYNEKILPAKQTILPPHIYYNDGMKIAQNSNISSVKYSSDYYQQNLEKNSIKGQNEGKDIVSNNLYKKKVDAFTLNECNDNLKIDETKVCTKKRRCRITPQVVDEKKLKLYTEPCGLKPKGIIKTKAHLKEYSNSYGVQNNIVWNGNQITSINEQNIFNNSIAEPVIKLGTIESECKTNSDENKFLESKPKLHHEMKTSKGIDIKLSNDDTNKTFSKSYENNELVGIQEPIGINRAIKLDNSSSKPIEKSNVTFDSKLNDISANNLKSVVNKNELTKHEKISHESIILNPKEMLTDVQKTFVKTNDTQTTPLLPLEKNLTSNEILKTEGKSQVLYFSTPESLEVTPLNEIFENDEIQKNIIVKEPLYVASNTSNPQTKSKINRTKRKRRKITNELNENLTKEDDTLNRKCRVNVKRIKNIHKSADTTSNQKTINTIHSDKNNENKIESEVSFMQAVLLKNDWKNYTELIALYSEKLKLNRMKNCLLVKILIKRKKSPDILTYFLLNKIFITFLYEFFSFNSEEYSKMSCRRAYLCLCTETKKKQLKNIDENALKEIEQKFEELKERSIKFQSSDNIKIFDKFIKCYKDIKNEIFTNNWISKNDNLIRQFSHAPLIEDELIKEDKAETDLNTKQLKDNIVLVTEKPIIKKAKFEHHSEEIIIPTTVNETSSIDQTVVTTNNDSQNVTVTTLTNSNDCSGCVFTLIDKNTSTTSNEMNVGAEVIAVNNDADLESTIGNTMMRLYEMGTAKVNNFDTSTSNIDTLTFSTNIYGNEINCFKNDEFEQGSNEKIRPGNGNEELSDLLESIIEDVNEQHEYAGKKIKNCMISGKYIPEKSLGTSGLINPLITNNLKKLIPMENKSIEIQNQETHNTDTGINMNVILKETLPLSVSEDYLDNDFDALECYDFLNSLDFPQYSNEVSITTDTTYQLDNNTCKNNLDTFDFEANQSDIVQNILGALDESHIVKNNTKKTPNKNKVHFNVTEKNTTSREKIIKEQYPIGKTKEAKTLENLSKRLAKSQDNKKSKDNEKQFSIQGSKLKLNATPSWKVRSPLKKDTKKETSVIRKESELKLNTANFTFSSPIKPERAEVIKCPFLDDFNSHNTQNPLLLDNFSVSSNTISYSPLDYSEEVEVQTTSPPNLVSKLPIEKDIIPLGNDQIKEKNSTEILTVNKENFKSSSISQNKYRIENSREQKPLTATTPWEYIPITRAELLAHMRREKHKNNNKVK